ncbi:glycosyltransferase involved in cell wall biosynthesis [Methanohalophilus levihalophilus]|uniref:glycosyltransferase family 2 protein n=1 Tax=Methanohalophilus levihalophilus TaxID=1431282 RepID=UPI001AE81F40|nr:glycosyltransferase [Methanohalophilus levihalophilus]MBP2029468.1 glycosyltransferase involved in cell wall biosynthesis [Methanohalophilus levihalophilus]
MGLKDYILITPCKDEEENLPNLTESVISQTIQPKIWVIVDDGSTDGTSKILETLSHEHSWIHVLTLSQKPRNLGIHVAHVYREGFDYAIKKCKNKRNAYNYVGCVDADIILEKDHFELLIEELSKNPNLGICSGRVGNIVGEKIVWSEYREDIPSGGARLWSRECFEETGGYLLTSSPDSVSNVKAKLRGWQTKQFCHIEVISSRPYASAEGQFKGYRKLGANNYYIGYAPLHIILKGIKMLYSRKGYFKTGIGIAYIYGYFLEFIKRAPKIDDPEIINYYSKARVKEILCRNLKSARKQK